ncbi:MAG TPA: FAD-linked oxidase C-terminal domain-containing protein [Beijerinckiaceae bacterium]|jgi:FAD/FMN-containing dehydrogenase/Fe-S oxidoreductase|nr:FAD-linked oxidase C-terminal domain-containing protein [Beijerinckiaceae bacterium]
MANSVRPGLERRLRREVSGEVAFDRFARGRYATDASHYQMMPLGVVVPRTMDEAVRALAVAREEGIAVTPRGAGTSQSGQAINSGLVIDGSKYLNRLLSLDVAARRCVVEPGIVLDELNRLLKSHGLWFPVDVSTASRATIGGMAGNNSCGGRSLRYGTMRDNVVSIDAVLADGERMHFGPVAAGSAQAGGDATDPELIGRLLAIGEREADDVMARFPKVQRRVGGYNLDALLPNAASHNLAHILVGSEGTLAYSTAIELKLWPVLGKRALGVCHFGSFHEAMDAAQHLVRLKPIAIELVDATMIALASSIAMFRPTLEAFLRGEPEALLVVEFAETEAENRRRLKELHELMGELGFGWDRERRKWGGVVDVLDPALQSAIADLRTSGLNIMMSMKSEGKPVSFVEDCAVPLPKLAEYTQKLTEIFAKHGTRGTWYAHASEGCLHVRPILNLKLEKDVKAMRAIAEETFALVRAYKGSHSGEHGDGLVRSEFHEAMFGARLTRAFEEVKDIFDPAGLMNPGKIVRAPKFDDRTLFRYPPGYRAVPLRPVLDWSEYPGGAGGFQGAAEMCNNNGACRKLEGGAMCPSYRVTRDEQHVTRGRANTLRLALSGALGKEALASDKMAQALELCVACKACKHECPTGIDMARMKIEVDAARAKRNGFTLFDRLVGSLPRYAPIASRFAWLMNLRDRVPGAALLTEWIAGFAAERTLPVWRSDFFRAPADAVGPDTGHEVVLFADSFNRYFEPRTISAALAVLVAGGYRVHLPKAVDGASRPLCCGRSYLSTGDIDAARREAKRSLAALVPFAKRGVPIIGLEPSCLLSFRDEILALGLGDEAKRVAEKALLLEEFLVAQAQARKLKLAFAPANRKALLHTHCHQKAFGIDTTVARALKLVPGLEVETVASSCCGMAGSFGYQAKTLSVSKAMGELSLLPAVRAAAQDTVIVADGTSCRHQIADGSGRSAVHVACVLAESLEKVTP